MPSFFEISETRIPLRYNIAPGQIVPVIVCGPGGERQLVEMEWGIAGQRFGLRSRSNRLINVRSETAGSKKLFQSAFRSRRCLVPASGFFEWKKEERKRLPYYFYPSDDTFLGLAAIWEPRQNGNSPAFAILTCPANPVVAAIHDRMPATVHKEFFADWLEPATDEEKLSEMLVAPSSVRLNYYPVSTLVNSPRNDTKECIRPLQNSPPRTLF